MGLVPGGTSQPCRRASMATRVTAGSPQPPLLLAAPGHIQLCPSPPSRGSQLRGCGQPWEGVGRILHPLRWLRWVPMCSGAAASKGGVPGDHQDGQGCATPLLATVGDHDVELDMWWGETQPPPSSRNHWAARAPCHPVAPGPGVWVGRDLEGPPVPPPAMGRDRAPGQAAPSPCSVRAKR